MRGQPLRGIVTAVAAEELVAAGVDLGVTVTVGTTPIRIEGNDGKVTAVVTDDGTTACDTLIVSLGFAPRDVLSRMTTPDMPVRTVGPAAERFDLPPCPTSGHRLPVLEGRCR